MALTSALFTGLTGLDVNQTRLNVVGNNIANVNTVAFKASRALFKPQFYVTDAAGSPPDAEFGGSNPSQRGLGATVASIEKNWTPGSIEPTGRNTDLAIDGQGFFVVKGKEQFYTRDGSFNLNSKNQLVTSDGQFVQGFGVDDNENVIAGQLQNVTIPVGGLTKAAATTGVALSGNLNAGGVASAAGRASCRAASSSSAAGGPVTDATPLTSRQRLGRHAACSPAGDVLSAGGNPRRRGGRNRWN